MAEDCYQYGKCTQSIEQQRQCPLGPVWPQFDWHLRTVYLGLHLDYQAIASPNMEGIPSITSQIHPSVLAVSGIEPPCCAEFEHDRLVLEMEMLPERHCQCSFCRHKMLMGGTGTYISGGHCNLCQPRFCLHALPQSFNILLLGSSDLCRRRFTCVQASYTYTYT